MISFETVSKFFLSTLEFWAIFLISFSLFRIPIKYRLTKMLMASGTITLLYNLQTQFKNLEDYAFLTQMIIFVLFVIFAFELPLLFGILISLIGITAFSIFQILIIVSLTGLNIIHSETFNKQLHEIATVQLLELTLALIVSYLFYRYKLGFAFVANRVKFSKSTKKINYLIIALFVLGIIDFQFIVLNKNSVTTMFSLIVLLSIIFIILIYIIYKKNKSDIKDKMKRSDKIDNSKKS